METNRAWAALRSAAPAFVWGAVVVMGAACGMRTEAEALFPELADYAGREIAEVRFVNPAPFTADTLEELVETEASHCDLLGLPICLPGTDLGEEERRLDLDVLRRDVRRLALFYRRSGYYGTEVRPAAEEVDDAVAVSFVIRRGDAVITDSLTVVGTEGIVDPDSLERMLRLQRGELFDLGDFAASADTVLQSLRTRGYAYAEVLRSYTVDTIADRAVGQLTAIPGPQVFVDSIIVRGAENLGREATLRQLTLAAGDLLQPAELLVSQRNLYALELVQIATVTLAPDTLQATPADSTTATLLVQIAEAPVHVVEAAAGYGTVDCFRAEARWVSRSFAGVGARRLELRGVVSKIGSGSPLDFGFGGSVCSDLENDVFAAQLDYLFSAELREPAFLDPNNVLTLTAYAEQRTEPEIFQREAQGIGVALVRQLPLEGLVLTAGLDLERGRTIASPGVFCVALLVCRPEDIAELADARWRNSLSGSAAWDRTDQPVNPQNGYRVRTGAEWATEALASDVDFLRWTGETAGYRSFRPRWVVAGLLRLGSFFGTASLDPDGDFLPPEERFYTGGANSVRGFARNELGPGVYVALDAERDTATGTLLVPEDTDVRFVPIGGTALAVTSVELRLPAPFGGESVGAALFIDAGALGTGELWDLDANDWRVTPGAGLRIQTPVGPARVDLAYNPYNLASGPLFAPDPVSGDLIRIADDFSQEPESFLGRFRLHLAVGQPY